MNDKTKTDREEKREAKREVMTRFTPSELNAMKDETGATADATAVAAFVRKNLCKRMVGLVPDSAKNGKTN